MKCNDLREVERIYFLPITQEQQDKIIKRTEDNMKFITTKVSKEHYEKTLVQFNRAVSLKEFKLEEINEKAIILISEISELKERIEKYKITE